MCQARVLSSSCHIPFYVSTLGWIPCPVDNFVSIITEVYSAEDVPTLLEAHASGQKVVATGKANRAKAKANKITEAKRVVEETTQKLAKNTMPDLLDDMHAMLKEGNDQYL